MTEVLDHVSSRGDSHIRPPNDESHGMRRFEIDIRVKIDSPAQCVVPGHKFRNDPGIALTFNCQEQAHETQSAREHRIFQAFAEAIDANWNGHLWIAPTQSGGNRRRGRRDLTNAFMCKINIIEVTNPAQAHLNIMVGHGAMPAPGNYHFPRVCALGGYSDRSLHDMYVPYPEVNPFDYVAYRDAPSALNQFNRHETVEEIGLVNQNTAAHELGHFLHLGHTCELNGCDSNSLAGYCIGPRRAGSDPAHVRDSIMAVGNRFFPEHTYPFKARINRYHHVADGQTFEGHCMRDGDRPG